MKNTDDIQVQNTGGIPIKVQSNEGSNLPDLFIVDVGPVCMSMNDEFHKSVNEQQGN